METKSPLSNKPAKFIKSISTKTLTDYYLNSLDIDVTSYFQNMKEINILKCEDSTYKFFLPNELSGNNTFYKQLEKIPWYYQNWKWDYQTSLSFLSKNDEVLEVGCGNGSFLKKILSDVKKVVGLELNENAVIHGKENGIPIFNEMIENFAINNSNKFSIVCSFQVLEHISNVHSFLSGCIETLKPDGKLIIAVPNNEAFFYSWENILSNENRSSTLQQRTLALNAPPHHMGLWDKYSLKNLEQYFPIKLNSIHTEPVLEHRKNLNNELLKSKLSKFNKNPFYSIIFFLYKLYYRKELQLGDSILCVFTKNKN